MESTEVKPPKKRNRTAAAAIPAAAPNITIMPSQEELTALFHAMDPEARAKLMAASKIKPTLANAFSTIITTLASVGITFKDPCITVGSPEDDDEKIIGIDPDGSYADLSDDEEEDEDEEKDDETIPTAKKLIKALREKMEEDKLSQSDVATKLKLSQATISTWMQGTSEPRNGNSKKLAKFVAHYLE